MSRGPEHGVSKVHRAISLDLPWQPGLRSPRARWRIDACSRDGRTGAYSLGPEVSERSTARHTSSGSSALIPATIHLRSARPDLGGGVRLGYLFGDLVQAEAEVLFPSEYTVGSRNTRSIRSSAAPASSSMCSTASATSSTCRPVTRGSSSATPAHMTSPTTERMPPSVTASSSAATWRCALRPAGSTRRTRSRTFGTEAVTHFVGTVGLSIFAPSEACGSPAACARAGPSRRTAADAAAARAGRPIRTECRTRTTRAPTRRSGPRWTRAAARSTPIATGFPTGSTAVPTRPAGAIVDVTGCSGDADHDGVVEGIDRCPNTPTGATVDAMGCSGDADHDGVSDGLDKCPDTPPWVRWSTQRAARRIRTRDGVRDGLDKCPNTPQGHAGGRQWDARMGRTPTGTVCPTPPTSVRERRRACRSMRPAA